MSVTFTSEQRFQRITKEGPLILKMTAEAVHSPVAQIVDVAVEEHGATAGMHHVQVI